MLLDISYIMSTHN